MLKSSKEIRNGGIRNTNLYGDGISNPVDLLPIIDDDDELADGEIIGMTVPDGFQLQMSPPPTLDVASEPGLVRLGLGWFRGVITRQAQEKQNRLEYVWLPCDP